MVHAVTSGKQSVQASAAPDVWALGCIAWELLTGTPVFTPDATPSSMQEAFDSGTLPWQQPASREALVPRLRMLERTVLACLQTEPNKRPTSREVLGAWNGLFETLTGTTRDAFGARALPELK